MSQTQNELIIAVLDKIYNKAMKLKGVEVSTKTEIKPTAEQKVDPPPREITVTDPATIRFVQLIDQGKYEDARQWVTKKEESEEQKIELNHVFDAFPPDGAHAFYQVLREGYGFIEQMGTSSWFSSKPPQMLNVAIDRGKTMQVPWMKMAVPGIEGELWALAVNEHGTWKFQLHANVKRKHMRLVEDLAQLTREYLRAKSIYRGRAVSLNWLGSATFFGNEEGFDTPTFMPKNNFTKGDLILPQVIADEVDATIWSLIQNSDKAKAMRIPTKRLVLASGPYGVGKTLMAGITAEICESEGRTFIYLKDVTHLSDAIYFAQQYAPACIFGEDIDSVAHDEDLMDEISNVVDGIDTKGIDCLIILTTNHINKIPRKFLRSGRSDMIIQFEPPDADAATRLIIKYGSSTLDPDVTHDSVAHVGAALAAERMIPASIREVVERAKLFALAKCRDLITADDIETASHGVIAQCELLKDEPPPLLPSHLSEVGLLVKSTVTGRSLVK